MLRPMTSRHPPPEPFAFLPRGRLTRRQALITAAIPAALAAPVWMAAAGASPTGRARLSVASFRKPGDGNDWTPALNRAFAHATAAQQDLELPGGPQVLALSGPVEIRPDASGYTPWLHGRGSFLKLIAVGAGFRYRGRKDGTAENPLTGGISDLVIDYAHLGDPKVNSGVRGIYLSNGGGDIAFERVRGVNMAFGYHIQNWRYADGGSPGGGLTTRDCDCSGRAGDHAGPKWYPFADQGDLSVGMPGEVLPPGESTVLATAQDRTTGYNARQPALSRYWKNATARPVRIPAAFTADAYRAAGLSEGPATATVNGTTLDAIVHAYWASGGRRTADCVVPAKGGLIDGADHDGGYYGSMLSGVERYEVRNYRSRNAVRGFAGQNGARNVSLAGIRIVGSQSSAILAGYNAPGWRIDDFEIEATNDRWIGEALLNFQLGAERTIVGRGTIRMGDDQKTGQFAVKFGPNSPHCRIEGPLAISGDCARAYIAVESAWDRSLSRANPENYPQHDYRGIASIAMEGVALRNITIAAASRDPQVPTAIAIIEASDGSAEAGGHGEIPIVDLAIENVQIVSDKHVADIKYIRSLPARPGRGLSDTVSVERVWAGSGSRRRALAIVRAGTRGPGLSK